MLNINSVKLGLILKKRLVRTPSRTIFVTILVSITYKAGTWKIGGVKWTKGKVVKKTWKSWMTGKREWNQEQEAKGNKTTTFDLENKLPVLPSTILIKIS